MQLDYSNIWLDLVLFLLLRFVVEVFMADDIRLRPVTSPLLLN